MLPLLADFGVAWLTPNVNPPELGLSLLTELLKVTLLTSSLSVWLSGKEPNRKGTAFAFGSLTPESLSWEDEEPNLNGAGRLAVLSSCFEPFLLLWSAVLDPKINGEVDSPLVLTSELPTPNLIDGTELIFEFKELLTGNLKGEEEKVWLPPKVEPAAETVPGLAPGFGVWQATQVESSLLLLTMQASQVQEPAGGANLAAKLLSGTEFDEMPNDGFVVAAVVFVAPGFSDWQATQVLSVDLFWSMHVSQVHESSGGANFFIKSWSELTTPFDDNTWGLTPGFGASQATSFVLLASLSSIRESHDHDPAGGANFFIKSLLEAGGFLGAGFPVDGLDDWHATHFTSVALFDTKQVSHVQEPGNGANFLRRLLLGSTCFSICFVCDDNEKQHRTINMLFTIHFYHTHF